MPNLLPSLLPWLAVLGLLALPSNRNGRAWWIWAPLVAVTLLGAGLGLAAEAADNEGLSYIFQTACAAAFGLAAVWLLGASLARRHWALSMVLMALAFAVLSLLALVITPAWGQLLELRTWVPLIALYLLVCTLMGGVIYAGALTLTGWGCRKKFSRLRACLLLASSLWLMSLLAAALLGGIMTLGFGEGFDWTALLLAPLLVALVGLVIILPFVILSFTNSFYRQRLEDLLRLPTTEPSPPPQTPSPVAELTSPH